MEIKKMYHPRHDEAKNMAKMLEARVLDDRETLMALAESIALLKSSVTEASVFLEQGNMRECAQSLGNVYFDASKLHDHVIELANEGILTKVKKNGG